MKNPQFRSSIDFSKENTSSLFLAKQSKFQKSWMLINIAAESLHLM